MAYQTRVRSLAFTAFLLIVLAAAAFAGISPTRAATDTSVSIVDFGFSDATITVEVGSSVTWSNDGATTHTVTADGGEFDSGDLAPGDSFTVTFDTPGTFGYICEIHPSMIGTVIVTEASDGGTGDGGGTTDNTSDLPDTGSGTPSQNHSANLLLLALIAIAFVCATMFKRALNR